MLALFVLSLILPLIPVPVHAVANWYDTSWLYRKSISINGTTAGVQTNYQLPFHVYFASTNNTDGTERVSLSGGVTGNTTFGRIYLGGKCQTDFDDLRFTKSDGITKLDAWLENSTVSNNGTVWVEFDYIPASPGTQTFYVYYGNSSALSDWSGSNTFINFEDFEWSTNTTALTTSGGTVTWSVNTAGTSVGEISTTQAYGGTRSGRLYRDGANNIAAYFTKTAADNYAVMLRMRKDDNTQINSVQGNGVYRCTVIIQTDEDIVYYNGGYVDTGYDITITTWTLFEFRNNRFASGTFDMYMNDALIANATMWANAGTANLIYHQLDSGTGETFIDNVIVRKYCNPEPTFGTWGTEEYFDSSSYLAFQDIKIFEGFKETGDWLVTIRYLNKYPPYYDTYDIRQYFVFRLLNLAGTEIARTSLPAWGNKVGCIYLSASQVAVLNWGTAYTIQVYGTFTGNPYTAYTLTSTDWIGADLSLLDSWVITSAGVIGAYYSTLLTTNVSTRGEVLNSDGSTVFNLGIPGLMLVRPNLFQIYTGSSTASVPTYTQANRSDAWQSKIGTKATALLTNMGSFINTDGRTIGVILCILLMVIIGAFCFMPNHTMASNALTVPVLAIGIGLLLFDQALIAVIFLIGSSLVLWQLLLNKGG